MDRPLPFAEVLEAVDRLSAEDQESLVEIVRRRVAERGRKRLADEVREARSEFERGGGRPTTAGDLMDEILS